MRRRSFLTFGPLTVLTAVALAACSEVVTSPQSAGSPSLAVASSAAVSDRFIVSLKPNASPEQFSAQIKALGGTVELVHKEAGIAIVSGLGFDGATALGNLSAVADMGRDVMVQVDFQKAAEDASDAAAPLAVATSGAKFFNRQWDYAAIGADRAWAAGKNGSSAVRVAILDSGIDHTYPDLAGLVDLTHSIAFVNDKAVFDVFFPGQTFNPLYDLVGHGTHVASTVASKGGVVAGMTTNTRLMNVKVLTATGSGPFSAIINGILYAVDNGADVINMSIGAGVISKAIYEEAGLTNQDYRADVRLLNSLAKYADKRGVTVVVAAGNESTDMDLQGEWSIFCDAKNVICVSATGPKFSGPIFAGSQSTASYTTVIGDVDAPATYSNFGHRGVEVAAPGGSYQLTNGGATLDPSTGIVSVGYIWQACSHHTLNFNPNVPATEPPIKRWSQSNCSLNPTQNRTAGFVGTSMASPHVAGLAALLVAERGRNPGAIKAAIASSADDLGAPGRDDYYGRGRINVARALGLQ